MVCIFRLPLDIPTPTPAPDHPLHPCTETMDCWDHGLLGRRVHYSELLMEGCREENDAQYAWRVEIDAPWTCRSVGRLSAASIRLGANSDSAWRTGNQADVILGSVRGQFRISLGSEGLESIVNVMSLHECLFCLKST